MKTAHFFLVNQYTKQPNKPLEPDSFLSMFWGKIDVKQGHPFGYAKFYNLWPDFVFRFSTQHNDRAQVVILTLLPAAIFWVFVIQMGEKEMVGGGSFS